VIYRDENSSNPGGGKISLQEAMAVAVNNGNFIVFLDSERPQAQGELIYSFLKLGIAIFFSPQITASLSGSDRAVSESN